MSNSPDHHPYSPDAGAGPSQSGLDHASVEETLRAYRNVPVNERNWQRDPGFQMLSESEKHHELIEEAFRDTRNLSVTLRHTISNDTRAQRLRDLLVEIDLELHRERYDTI